jgi:hypothetical protein
MTVNRKETGSGEGDLSRRSWLKVVGVAGLGLWASGPRAAMSSPTAPGQERRKGAWEDFVEQQLLDSALPHSQVGIRIHFAVEGMSRGDADKLRGKLKFGLLHDPVEALSPPVFETTDCDEVAVVRLERPAAPYRLRFEFPENRRDVAIRVFQQRQTELVLHRDAEGLLHLRQYAPRAEGGREPLVMKKLGEVQRQIEDDRGHEARKTLDELEQLRADDPVALSVRAYLLNLDGHPKRLEQVAKRLVKDYPDLPDGHVALASVAQVSNDRQAIITEYRNALSLGLPMLLPFLESLWNGARLYQMDLGSEQPYGTQLTDAAQNRIQNQLWSAWRLA